MKHVDSTCENADLANESHDDPATISRGDQPEWGLLRVYDGLW